jgi:hypothetical protein
MAKSLRLSKLATLKSSTRWEAIVAKVRQALKTSYTKELVIISLRECKWESKMIILPRRGDEPINQSTLWKLKEIQWQETSDFSPKVHVDEYWSDLPRGNR